MSDRDEVKIRIPVETYVACSRCSVPIDWYDVPLLRAIPLLGIWECGACYGCIREAEPNADTSSPPS